jgi:uncharacterized protein YcaQ
LRSLGVARPRHIFEHYTSGRYPNLDAILADLETQGRIQRVEVRDEERVLPGPWYVHVEDLPLLARLQADEWEPRTTLLSPFDNLISERPRAELLWNYRFRLEIYVPKAKREYGYYVLSILHGDRLIGRLDPTMDRKAKRLTINAVYAEPDAPVTDATGRAVAGAVEELATFLGAREIVYTERVPEGWRGSLK